jgi:predicted nucleic acid-binding Zn ribbon protein
MAEAHIGPLPDGTRHCRVCAEPINERAGKCIHCQSEQSRWRQLLSFSTSVLALLVALIAVLTASVPVIKDALTLKVSNLSFAFQDATNETFAISVSNSGVRPGILSRATLRVSQGVTKYDIPLKQESMNNTRPIVIDPGKSELIISTHCLRVLPRFPAEISNVP